MKNIHEKLSQIQRTIAVGKDQFNQFGKYKFRNAEDILAAAKPLIPEGFIIVCVDEMVELFDRPFIRTIANFTDGEQSVTSPGFGAIEFTKKGVDDSQAIGIASSYARKYALSGLLAIADAADDPDGHENKGTEQKPEQKQKPKPKPKPPEETRDTLLARIIAKNDFVELQAWFDDARVQNIIEKLPKPMQNEINAKCKARAKELDKSAAMG